MSDTHNPGSFPAAPPAPGRPPLPRNMRVRRTVAASVLLLLTVAGGLYAWQQSKSNPDSAGAGDCVAHDGADSIKVVDCGDSSAAYRVMGKVDNKTEPAFQLSSGTICKPFPGVTKAFWRGKIGSTGYVLCLGGLR